MTSLIGWNVTKHVTSDPNGYAHWKAMHFVIVKRENVSPAGEAIHACVTNKLWTNKKLSYLIQHGSRVGLVPCASARAQIVTTAVDSRELYGKKKRFWADFLNAVYFRRGLTCTSEITNDLMDASSFPGSFPYPASPGGRGREKSLGTRMWWTVANQELNFIYVKRSQITNRFWPGPLCFRYSRYRLSVITTTVRLIHQSIAKCHQF